MADTKKTCCYKTPTGIFNVGTGCQFMDEPGMDERLVQVGGLWFCPHHLPFSAETLKKDHGVDEESDHEAFKKNWSWERIATFNADIHTRLDKALEEKNFCNLTGIIFPGDINFVGKEMPEVSFACAQFSGGWANFEGAQFSGGWADFQGAHFSGGWANFQGAQFSGGWANFENAHFSGGPADFRGAHFSGGMADFTNAHFEYKAHFDAPASLSDNTSTDTHFPQVYFINATFMSDVTFNNRTFLDSTSFTGATFNKAPTFHGCTLHQDTSFPALENFKDTRDEYAAHAYRTLRLAMKQQEAHEEEAMFWALEQRSKRNNLDWKQPKNWFPWGLSWGYDLLSNYGLNAGLPARWLAGWVACSTVIYAWVAGSGAKLASLDHWLGALGFSIAQMARPFFIWGDYDGSDIKAALGSDDLSFLIKILATVDSIVSLTLVALFILAVRRRFRMQ